MDGSHPGYNNVGRHSTGELIGTSNVCTAVNGHEGNGIYANARCCAESDPNNYKLDCKQIWGSPSGTSDDSVSSITCPSGYFLSSCNVMSYWKEIDGAKPSTSGNTCYAYNGLDGNSVWAVGICCKQYSKNRRRRRRSLVTDDDEYVDVYYGQEIYDGGCNGFDCIDISGIKNKDYNITNGQWIEHGCYNDHAYYRLEQIEDSFNYTNENYQNVTLIKEYYLYKSNTTGN